MMMRFQPKDERQLVELRMNDFVNHLGEFISPRREIIKGSWRYKFSSSQELKCLLDSIVVFISNPNGDQGINLFDNGNEETWRIVVYESKSPLFIQLRSVTGGYTTLSNLYKKYARFAKLSTVPLTFPEFLPPTSYLVQHLYAAKQGDLYSYTTTPRLRKLHGQLVIWSNKFLQIIYKGKKIGIESRWILQV